MYSLGFVQSVPTLSTHIYVHCNSSLLCSSVQSSLIWSVSDGSDGWFTTGSESLKQEGWVENGMFRISAHDKLIYILTTALFTLYASNSRGLHPCIHCELDLDYLLHCWVVDIRITLWNIVFVLNVLQVSGTSKGFVMERPVPYFLSPGIPDGSLNNTERIAYWNTRQQAALH